jgi:flagellar operon protein
MNINDQFMPPIRPVGPVERPEVKAPVTRPDQTKESFEQVLSTELSRQQIDVKFSAHAMQRMHLNRIDLTSEQLRKIGGAIDRAADKGAREALLIMGDMALVTSIKNRTVITVVNGERMRENIFTNIDSAVIL